MSCRRPELRVAKTTLPADGFSSTTAEVFPPEATLRVVEGERFLRVDGKRLLATVLPGRAVVASSAGLRASVQTTAVWSDYFHDGTPDVLRLDDPGDERAFRKRFVAVAEEQCFRETLPPEVTDCSSLVRYAYRESFRGNDGPAKYQFPWTPLGARIFRIRAGAFDPADLTDGSFGEFADAGTLRQWNTHFVSRDIRRAKPGDLLFYRQLDQRSAWHTMIFTGTHLVYHTGPTDEDKGEMRRPALEELMAHPQPKWRPLAGNSNFLGVYRWNILRQES